MNWFSISPRAVIAAAIAAAVGFALYGVLVAKGVEAPWIVAVLAGPTAAVFSRGKNVIRGLLIGTLATWVAAAAQAFFVPITPGEPVWLGLVHFHETLTVGRFFGYLATAVIAVVAGAWSPFPAPPPARKAAI